MYDKEKRLYDIEMSSYVGASSQVPGYLQQEESTQNELATYLEQDNNVSNHHDDDEPYRNDMSDEVRSSLVTTETSQVATTTLGSPYNGHSYEQYINESERGIGSEFEEEEFIETKDDVKLEDEYESDMTDELKAEREEAMECEDEIRMEDDENEKKETEGEAADNKEENIVNEIGGGSEND